MNQKLFSKDFTLVVIGKSQDHCRRKKIQDYHNISFIDPVRYNAAEGKTKGSVKYRMKK